jgi:hypothetical protein
VLHPASFQSRPSYGLEDHSSRKTTKPRWGPRRPLPNWNCVQRRDPAKAPASLQSARCTGREFPNGNASPSLSARNAAPKRWTGPSPPQMCQTQAIGCLRRGIELQPCAQGRLSNGPCCIQFPKRRVTSSMVRKDSPDGSIKSGCFTLQRCFSADNFSPRICGRCFANSCTALSQRSAARGPKDDRNGRSTRKFRYKNSDRGHPARICC